MPAFQRLSRHPTDVAAGLPRRRPLIVVLVVCLLLAACAESPPPPPPEAKDPKANPLAGTVLDAQGEALRKAKQVDQAVLDQAEAQRKAIDAAEGQ